MQCGNNFYLQASILANCSYIDIHYDNIMSILYNIRTIRFLPRYVIHIQILSMWLVNNSLPITMRDHIYQDYDLLGGVLT